MATIEQLAREIVAREGGFVNDPDDPGGATKYGVTLATLRGIRGPGVTVRDVMALTRADAAAIFIEHYFRRPRINQLPACLHDTVFDMQVNAGTNAVRILQRLLTRLGWPCADDGAIGPKTVAAAQAAERKMGRDGLRDAYGVARRDYYYAIGDARPASRKYARRVDGGKGGWITRAEEFMRPEARLTEAQHRQRTKGWA